MNILYQLNVCPVGDRPTCKDSVISVLIRIELVVVFELSQAGALSLNTA